MDSNNYQVSPSNAHKIDYEADNIFSVLGQIFKYGDQFTKASYFIMGLSNLVRGQIAKGLIFLCSEIIFIWFMISYGIANIKGLITLGEQGYTVEIVDGFEKKIIHDQSIKLLLFGVVTLFIIAGFVLLWKGSVKSAYLAQYDMQRGKRPKSFIRDIRDLFDINLHKTLLAAPITGIVFITIVPLIFSIFIAFTNFSSKSKVPGQPPPNGTYNLFDWVGFENFKNVLGMGDYWGSSFWKVLGWTIVWAILATFTTYIGGMLLAMLINRKGIKYKAIWRTLFVISVAVPQFVTLLLISKLFSDNGAVNGLLRDMGIIGNQDYLPFFSNTTWARFMVVIINFWVGVPYSMLVMTGILMNIPADLYESAKIDGANNKVMFFKITLPYMIFVTTPNLITSFIGNVNNFNVIYLLTGGQPVNPDLYYAGDTDLLVTWLYKLTKDQGYYGEASAIGILIFIISAVFSLVTYRQSGSYKNEEEFQ